jgi:hypothetical protein
LPVVLAPERVRGLGEAAHHQGIPRCQNLLVTPGFYSLLPFFEEALSALFHDLQQLVFRHAVQARYELGRPWNVEDALALEVSLGRDVEVPAEQVSVGLAQDLVHLLWSPDEKLPLVSLAVCVLGGVKTALRRSHFAQDIVERFLGDAAIKAALREEKGLQANPA